MEKRFVTLNTIGQVTSVLGYIVAGVGVVTIFVAFRAQMSDPHPLTVLLGILPGAGLVVGGLVQVGLGEAMRCFVAIEENTRAMAESTRHAEGKGP